MKSTILVEMVNEVSAETVEQIEKMVLREVARSGNKGLAIDRLCRDYGFTPAQIKHLRGGRAKDPKGSLIQRVKLAYLDHCQAMLKVIDHELKVGKRKYEDADFRDIEAEAVALAEKVRRAMEAQNRATESARRA